MFPFKFFIYQFDNSNIGPPHQKNSLPSVLRVTKINRWTLMVTSVSAAEAISRTFAQM